jgi:uncharacterized protein YjiS (DUF1127 family)
MNQIALPQTHSPEVDSLKLSLFAIVHCLTRVVMIPEKWRLRQKSRMEFACINKHALKDIGMSDAARFVAVNEPICEE